MGRTKLFDKEPGRTDTTSIKHWSDLGTISSSHGLTKGGLGRAGLIYFTLLLLTVPDQTCYQDLSIHLHKDIGKELRKFFIIFVEQLIWDCFIPIKQFKDLLVMLIQDTCQILTNLDLKLATCSLVETL